MQVDMHMQEEEEEEEGDPWNGAGNLFILFNTPDAALRGEEGGLFSSVITFPRISFRSCAGGGRGAEEEYKRQRSRKDHGRKSDVGDRVTRTLCPSACLFGSLDLIAFAHILGLRSARVYIDIAIDAFPC